MSEFTPHIEHGWTLVPIQPGSKGPRARGWNRKQNCITDPDHHMLSAGLAHAYSGTCALDVDDYPAAAAWLAERGVSLDELFLQKDSVQISSGRKDHGKLLYALPTPMASKQIKMSRLRELENGEKDTCILDFRCATAAGLTMQDVLPPSVHPDTGLEYKWDYADDMIGDWRDLPPLPPELYEIWLGELEHERSRADVPEKGAALDELRALLEHRDPDMSRDDWVRVGMAIHHETDGGLEGLNLWDEWSREGEKYVGRADLETVWRSFHDTPNAVTVGSLRQDAVSTPDEFPDAAAALGTNDPWADAEAAKRARFSLTHVSEIAQRDPPEWIVDNLVPQADLVMMYGNSGAGKSFLALDLSFAVASGFTWFNQCSKKGPVVWIAAEAAGAMRNRAKAYAQARGVQLETTELHVIEQTLSLMDREDARILTEVLGEVRPRMIVVDTLAAASGGANENSGEDMNQVLNHCRQLHAATGAMILLIHHSGKDASRGARGWSGIRAAVDAEFEVSYNASSPIRTLTVTKQRDGTDGTVMPFRLLAVPLGFDDATSCVIEYLDETMLGTKAQNALGGTQKATFQVIYALASEFGDEFAAVKLQDVYDAASVTIPAPPKGKRDRRSETVRRAVAKLHERGYVTVVDDTVSIGSPYDDELNNQDLP